MNARIFLDTNVLVYAFDQSAPVKQRRALDIVGQRIDGEWAISWQVIQEFSAVALHRFAQPMTPGDLRNLHQALLWPACAILPSRTLHAHALVLHEETQYRFYDCLIVAAAVACGVEELYSEDFQHWRTLGRVRLINPFTA